MTERVTPILTVEGHCACGGRLVIELRDALWHQVERVLDVTKAWNDAHAKHEVKKP